MSWTGTASDSHRLSKSQIEDKLLETAKKLIRENGLSVSLEHLRLDQLMDLAEVPKTSFYRVWDSKEAFFSRLLEELVAPDEVGGAAFDPTTLAVAENVIEEHPELLATADGRHSLLVEAIRRGAEQNFTTLTTSATWRSYTGILATLQSMSDLEARDNVLGSLTDTENYFVDKMAEFYDTMLPTLRYQMKPGLDTRQLAAVGAAVVEGLVQRGIVNPDLVDRRVDGPALDGGVTDWHISAIGFLGIAMEMIEPLPDA